MLDDHSSINADASLGRASTLSTGSVLAAAGGYLDGFTYIGHGHVFANAMTANVVLLGIGVLGPEWRPAFKHLPPILAFVTGIWAAKAIHTPAALRRIRDPHVAVLVVEIAILFLLIWTPSGFPNIAITTSVAFAASMQVQTFKTVEGQTYTSTFTTGNLRNLSDAIFDRLIDPTDKERAAHRVRVFATICSAFLLGAAAGGLATYRLGNHALWFEIVLLGVALILVTKGSRWPA